MKDKNDAQGVTIFGHSLQIQGNSNAIAAHYSEQQLQQQEQILRL